MAQSDKIKSEQVIQKDLFKNTQKSAEALSDYLTKLEIGFEDIIKVTEKLLKTNKLVTGQDIKNATKDINDLTKATKSLNEVKATKVKIETELTKQEAKQTEIKKKNIALTDKQIKEMEVRRILEKQRIDTLKALAVLETNQLGLEKKLLASNTLLRIRRDQLNVADKNYAADLKKINAAIDANNAKINQNADQLKQQKINVGNYTKSINAAISETGIFNNTIGSLISNLRSLIVTQDGAATGAKKFSNILKASGIGLIIASIAGITAAVKSSQGAIDEFSVQLGSIQDKLAEQWDFLKGTFGFEMSKIKTNYEDTAKAVIQLREETNKYNIDLQKLMLDEEDFRGLSDDITLSFNTRNKAMADANAKQQEIVDLNVKQAQKEYDLLKNKVFLNGKNAADLEAENAAQIKLNAALDAQSDLILYDLPRADRKRKAEQLQTEIDLLIGKKTSATAQLTILKDLSSNEKKQITERKQALTDLNTEINTNFDLALKTFNKYSQVTITQADAHRLLLATSKEEFTQDIIWAQLSAAEQETLAKIIVKTQDFKLGAAKTNEQILQDETDLKVRLLEIDRQVSKIRQDDLIRDAEIELKQEALKSTKMESEIMNKKLFDKKKLDLLKEQKTLEGSIEDKLFNYRKTELEQQAKDDKARVKEKGLQKEEETAELLKIEEKYQIDIKNLDEEAQRATQDRLDKDLEFIKKHEIAKAQIVASELANITNTFGNEIDKRSQKQQDAFEREANMREKSIQTQQDLAALGFENQLAFEKAQAEKQALAQRDALKRAEKQKEIAQLTEAYFNAYNAELSVEGATPTRAAAKALSDVLLAKGISKGLVQFLAEGTDSVKGAGTETSDSVPAMLSVNEAVIPAKANKKHKGVSKSLIDDTFDMNYLSMSQFNEAAKTIEKNTMEKAANMLSIQSNSEVIKLLKDLNNKPIQQVNVDNLGNLIETVYKNGIKTVTTYKSSKRI